MLRGIHYHYILRRGTQGRGAVVHDLIGVQLELFAVSFVAEQKYGVADSCLLGCYLEDAEKAFNPNMVAIVALKEE